MVKRANEIQIELRTLKSVEEYLIRSRQQWSMGVGDTLLSGAQLALDAAIDRVKLMQWERE